MAALYLLQQHTEYLWKKWSGSSLHSLTPHFCKLFIEQPVFIIIAIKNDHATCNVVQLLLNNVFEMNSGGHDGGSPLFVARLNDHESTVQLLLHNGSESDVTTNDRISPLQIACGNDILLRENDSKNKSLHTC